MLKLTADVNTELITVDVGGSEELEVVVREGALVLVLIVVRADVVADEVNSVVCKDVGGNKLGAPDGGMTKVAVSVA